MSELSRFLKKNKQKTDFVKYAATKSLTDEKGEPLLWTIKMITSKEFNAIHDECRVQKPIKGKPNQYTSDVDYGKFSAKILCAAIVEPDLNNKELQDSYGVMTPEALLHEMVDNPVEFAEFSKFAQEYNGFSPLNEEIEKAKN